MIYAVLDTNVIVSAVIARNQDVSVPYGIFECVANGKIIPLVDENVLNEYRDVLYRPKFHLFKNAADAIVNTILHCAINQEVPKTNAVLPDMADVVFYDVAMAHRDKRAYLVTGNLRHFPGCAFAVSPRNFLEIIKEQGMETNSVGENSPRYDRFGLLAALRELNEQAKAAGSVGMSEEEIEAEISAARAERAARRGKA
ncbi:MAG: PIN domain-containing protein [Fibrobacterales bacterium]|nr:PIN domain-containing protein [Fibrobacterales bacterium]